MKRIIKKILRIIIFFVENIGLIIKKVSKKLNEFLKILCKGAFISLGITTAIIFINLFLKAQLPFSVYFVMFLIVTGAYSIIFMIMDNFSPRKKIARKTKKNITNNNIKSKKVS